MWTGSLQATQLIYSDKAWAGYTIEQYLQTSREQGRNAVRLDILQAANAVYDFLIDLMAVQRSTGSFFLFAPEEERDAWMERLNRYMMDEVSLAKQG